MAMRSFEEPLCRFAQRMGGWHSSWPRNAQRLRRPQSGGRPYDDPRDGGSPEGRPSADPCAGGPTLHRPTLAPTLAPEGRPSVDPRRPLRRRADPRPTLDHGGLDHFWSPGRHAIFLPSPLERARAPWIRLRWGTPHVCPVLARTACGTHACRCMRAWPARSAHLLSFSRDAPSHPKEARRAGRGCGLVRPRPSPMWSWQRQPHSGYVLGMARAITGIRATVNWSNAAFQVIYWRSGWRFDSDTSDRTHGHNPSGRANSNTDEALIFFWRARGRGTGQGRGRARPSLVCGSEQELGDRCRLLCPSLRCEPVAARGRGRVGRVCSRRLYSATSDQRGSFAFG